MQINHIMDIRIRKEHIKGFYEKHILRHTKYMISQKHRVNILRKPQLKEKNKGILKKGMKTNINMKKKNSSASVIEAEETDQTIVNWIQDRYMDICKN